MLNPNRDALSAETGSALPDLETPLLAEATHAADCDRALRPLLLREYVGQEQIKESLQVFLEAARTRTEPLEHTLFSGPPGLGKTTLSAIIASEMSSRIHVISGPNLDKKGELASILAALRPRDVLFIDEIHRMHPHVEEVLYSAMEDFRLDLVAGHGSAARTVSIELAPFTLVGATTRSGMLSNPLRDRFGLQYRLELYPVEDLERIVIRSAGLLEVPIEPAAAREIACRSRGTPRIANRLVRRARDFSQVRPDPATGEVGRCITLATARAALALLRIDELGLEPIDRRYLDALIQRFGGGPVGLTTLASVIGEDRETLEEVYEPYLMRLGLVQKTPRGRMATRSAYGHLSLPVPGQVTELKASA